MEHAGLDYHFFDAVNGKALSEDKLNAYCDREAIEKNPQWLTPGAIGCALSHHALYEAIASGDAEWTLIAEDDIIVPPQLTSTLAAITKKADPDEIIMLHYQSWGALRLSRSSDVAQIGEYGLYPPVDINDVITTGAYLISKSAAAALAKHILPVRVSADSWGYFYKKGWVKGMRCIHPRLIEVAPLKSSIEYFRSPALNAVLRLIDRLQVPLLSQWLERRRALQLAKRLKVKLTEEPRKWQPK